MIFNRNFGDGGIVCNKSATFSLLQSTENKACEWSVITLVTVCVRQWDILIFSFSSIFTLCFHYFYLLILNSCETLFLFR